MLPPVPHGYGAWEYVGKGPLDVHIEMGSYLTPIFGKPKRRMWQTPGECQGDACYHYIRAVKAPAKQSASVAKALAIMEESRKRMNCYTPAQRAQLEKRGRALMARGSSAPAFSRALIIRASNKAARVAVKEIEAAVGHELPLSVCLSMVRHFAGTVSALGILAKGGRK